MASHLFAEASSPHAGGHTDGALAGGSEPRAAAILGEHIEIVDGTVNRNGHGLGLSWNEAAVANIRCEPGYFLLLIALLSRNL